MIRSGFFEAKNINGLPDRVYNSGHYANRWGNFIRTGIAIKGGGFLENQNKVTKISSTWKTEIAVGNGWIVNSNKEGYDYYILTPEQLTHESADPNNPRIDRIVLELNLTEDERTIKPKILKGIPSSNPIAPELTRNNDIYQISLAQIHIPANVGSLDTATITDERANKDLCGLSNITLGVDIPTPFEKNTLTIPHTDWINSTNTGGYTFKKDIDINGVGQNMFIEITVDINSLEIANEAEICPTIKEYNGGVTIYAKNIPKEDITAEYKVVM